MSDYSVFLIRNFLTFSDRGLCLPTVSLWLLFVYVEASVRLRELKNLPFHLDLCRPFAAHWYVKYTVVFRKKYFSYVRTVV